MADKILATVGTIQITDNDVTEFIQSLGQRGAGYNTPEGRRAVLQQLINSKLLLLDARRNLYEGEAAFRAELNRLKENLLINYAAEKVLSAVNVTEAEALKYYEENKERLAGGETVDASHILVADEALCLDIYKKIESGEMTFEDAAREYSTCPSGKEGGALGEFGRGQMVAEFDTAVFEMQVGEITKTPVKTQFGYHLIKLNAKNEARIPEFSEIKDELISHLTSEKQRAAYESKINQLKIMYPVDLAAF